MKRNTVIGVLISAIVLSTAGSATLATAQTRKTRTPDIIGNLSRRVCAPAPFDEILKTDFRGIRLNQRQNDAIRQAHQSYLNWVIDNSGANACFENGAIKAPWLGEYSQYEAVVRQTLNQRQLRQWERNVQAILRSRN